MKTSLRALVPLLGLVASAALLPGQDPTMRIVLGGHDGPPDAAHGVDRRGGGPGQPVMETESAAFLGVETAPVSATLTDQLNLPRGIGLVVVHVAPDSPAAAALKPHDILVKLDDQQLIDSRQLAVLIRNHREGDEVTLSYLRGGKEATAKAKLVLRLFPRLSMDSADAPGWSHELAPETVQGMLSLMSPREVEVKRVEKDGEPEIRIFKVNTGNSHVSFTDRLGALELTVVDGKQTLVAKNAKGEQLFSGPVDTPEQRKALPQEVRERLDRLEGQIKVDLSYKIDGDFKNSDPKAGTALPQSSMRRTPRGFPAPKPSLM
jgi:serine protease Do